MSRKRPQMLLLTYWLDPLGVFSWGTMADGRRLVFVNLERTWLVYPGQLEPPDIEPLFRQR